ncbi:MAG: hypothetical protein SGJ11_16320 [Phycisphaerae bacterium]|nr:hypothetical protein [Phycisphaerae bacterium]
MRNLRLQAMLASFAVLSTVAVIVTSSAARGDAARVPPVAPPEPTPSPAQPPQLTPPPEGSEITRDLLPEPPLVNGKKKRVHIIEDRFNEWSGTVEAESGDYIVIETKGKLKGFYKARISELIPLVEPEPGQPGIVQMRDGMRYRGVIIADLFEYVDIDIEGIKQRLPRASVQRTVLTLTPKQRYEKLRREIKADQFTERMMLCRYLFKEKLYHEAREELVSLLEAVELYEAKELLRVIEAQIALEAPVDPDNGARDALFDEDDPEGRRPSSRPPPPTRLLSPEDVNLIRVYEIDFRKPPKVVISNDTVRSMIEKYSASAMIPASAEGRAALFREDPIRLVRLLFDLKARDLYGEIEVMGEPWSLNLYRQKVHNTWLISNCATSKCHGGMDAGRFFLHQRNHASAQVRYTNLLLLERTKLPDRPPLIDWQKPRDSLVVQFGLPRSEARYPHPEVKGWRPVFNNSNRQLLDDFERWVRSMYQPRPEYPVDLEPPDMSAPDRPTPVDAPSVPR